MKLYNYLTLSLLYALRFTLIKTYFKFKNTFTLYEKHVSHIWIKCWIALQWMCEL